MMNGKLEEFMKKVFTEDRKREIPASDMMLCTQDPKIPENALELMKQKWSTRLMGELEEGGKSEPIFIDPRDYPSPHIQTFPLICDQKFWDNEVQKIAEEILNKRHKS